MPKTKYEPVKHNHKAFVKKASRKKGFREAYNALEPEYALAHQMLQARTRVGMTQEDVAQRMGTTKSAVSRLESAKKHAPSLATLQKYASALGCRLELRLVKA